MPLIIWTGTTKQCLNIITRIERSNTKEFDLDELRCHLEFRFNKLLQEEMDDLAKSLQRLLLFSSKNR